MFIFRKIRPHEWILLDSASPWFAHLNQMLSSGYKLSGCSCSLLVPLVTLPVPDLAAETSDGGGRIFFSKGHAFSTYIIIYFRLNRSSSVTFAVLINHFLPLSLKRGSSSYCAYVSCLVRVIQVLWVFMFFHE